MTEVLKIDGLKQLQKAFRDSPAIAAPILYKAMESSMLDILRKTAPITPIDTGELRRSLKRGITIKPTESVMASDKNYAVYVHEGTRYMTGRPFLRTGVKKSYRDVQKNFRDAVDRIMKAIKVKTETGL